MPNKANRILESIKVYAGIAVYKNITANNGILEEKWTTKRQSEYIKSVLLELILVGLVGTFLNKRTNIRKKHFTEH